LAGALHHPPPTFQLTRMARALSAGRLGMRMALSGMRQCLD
jgi:hypothetical protein